MPILYEQGIKKLLFNPKEFWLWLFFGVWQSAVCAWVAFWSLELSSNEEGYNFYFSSSGMATFHNAVIVGNLKILLFSHNFTVPVFFCVFGSIIFFIINHIIASVLSPTSDVYNTFAGFYGSGNFWLMNVLVIGICIFLDRAYTKYKVWDKY